MFNIYLRKSSLSGSSHIVIRLNLHNGGGLLSGNSCFFFSLLSGKTGFLFSLLGCNTRLLGLLYRGFGSSLGLLSSRARFFFSSQGSSARFIFKSLLVCLIVLFLCLFQQCSGIVSLCPGLLGISFCLCYCRFCKFLGGSGVTAGFLPCDKISNSGFSVGLLLRSELLTCHCLGNRKLGGFLGLCSYCAGIVSC